MQRDLRNYKVTLALPKRKPHGGVELVRLQPVCYSSSFWVLPHSCLSGRASSGRYPQWEMKASEEKVWGAWHLLLCLHGFSISEWELVLHIA